MVQGDCVVGQEEADYELEGGGCVFGQLGHAHVEDAGFGLGRTLMREVLLRVDIAALLRGNLG